MGKKKKAPSPESEPEVFHVEVITKARVAPVSSDEEDDGDDSDMEDSRKSKKRKRKGKGKGKQKGKPSAKWEYLVKWAGYSSNSDSWEPEANVADCQRLLAGFWNHVGTDNEDYSIGHVVEASEKWIKKERKFFAAEFNNNVQENLRLEREKEERERLKKSRKKRKISPSIDLMAPHPVASSSTKYQGIASDDSDHGRLLTIRLPVKRKRLLSHSSDEDDVPLMVSVGPPPRKTGAPDRAVIDNQGQVRTKQTVMEQPKIPLPRRSESIATSTATFHPHMLTSAITGQQVVDEAKGKTSEQSTPHQASSPTSLFSETLSPERPLSPQPVSRPAPEKPVPPSAKAPLLIAPRIPRRPTNPHSKLLGMAFSELASGSGISTKQRLAQGALNPTLPKAVAPAAGRPSLSQLKTPANSLMNLSFKKKSQASALSASGDGSSPRLPTVGRKDSADMQPPVGRQDPTLAALNAPSMSPSMSPMITNSDVPYVASPDHYNMSDQVPDPFMTNAAQPAWTHHPRIEDQYMAQAESFLQDIMPDALAAPLTPPVEKPYEPILPRSVVTQKLVYPLQRIPKKWSWSGPVYIDATGSRSEPLCNVNFLDATEHMGMRFSVVMGSMDFLDFPSFHNVVDLEAILRVCKPPLQYARLAPREAKDGKAMITLAKYMVKKEKVVLAPVFMDNNVVAHIIFFPHVITALCRRFKVPPEVQVAGSLVAVLVPWSFSPAQRSRTWRKPPSMYLSTKSSVEPMIADKARWERSIRTKPVYQHAIRMLQFPLWLHKFLSEEEHNRAFCVWWDTGDVKKKKAAMETMFLYSIMEQCRAKNPGSTSLDIRVVFVHVGALKTIHKFPSFVERCSKAHHIQFFTYGTHESIPPEEWGVREIYPCGGVVTFTPGAITEDPIGVLHKVRQVQSHPLWMCYILPSVLGMVAKLHCEGEDPLAIFDSGKFPYQYLLMAIEEGDLALLTAPPRNRTPVQSIDKNIEWIRDHWSSRPRDARTILEKSVAAFNSKYSKIQRSEWPFMIESEIAQDLSSMQRHPLIMAEHRRYVVLRNRTPRISTSRDSLEWTTPSQFDFKDDFFPKQM